MNRETVCHLWSRGQEQLAAGRYAAARQALERAADQAMRGGDVPSLARLFLPLLEVRRLMRYRAAEGRVLIVHAGAPTCRRQVRQFLREREGTLLLAGAERQRAEALRLVRGVETARIHTGASLEALLIFERPGDGRLRVTSPAAPTFAAGIGGKWTLDPTATVGISTDPDLCLPWPLPGDYAGKSGLGALARESLLIVWEALTLRWQARHPLPARAGPWEELRWLHAALGNPACEPVAMRLIALAEGMQRRPA